MQITKAEVIPVEMSLRRPVQMAGLPEIRNIEAVFVRIETRQGQTAWGCTVAHPDLTGEQPAAVLRKCREYACIVPDLHPTNLEYSLTELENLGGGNSPGALCAFDLAFHDLLCLAAGMPLYRSRLTRHDGPASVRRAYTPHEMQEMLRRTRSARLELSRHYLCRMGVIAWKR